MSPCSSPKGKWLNPYSEPYCRSSFIVLLVIVDVFVDDENKIKIYSLFIISFLRLLDFFAPIHYRNRF